MLASIKLESVKEILKSKGIPATTQRVAILEYLMDERNHPTVEDIYTSLKEKYPVFSKATVYNTLQTLVNAELAVELRIEKDRTHYDIQHEGHLHFYCNECGKVFDVEGPCKEERCYLLGVEDIGGHKVNKLLGYFYGTCKECLEKGGNNG